MVKNKVSDNTETSINESITDNIIPQNIEKSNKLNVTPFLEKFAELGFYMTPLEGKKPIFSNWQNAGINDIEALEVYHNKGYNFGILTGKTSNITVIDVDNPETFKSLPEYQPIDTMTVQSGKQGYHYYFQYDEELKINSTKVLNCLDVRNDNGQIVAPSSIHPETGKEYQLIKPFDITELTKDDIKPLPLWLKDLIMKNSRQVKTVINSDIEYMDILDTEYINKVFTGLENDFKKVIPKGKRSEHEHHLTWELMKKVLTLKEIEYIFNTYLPNTSKYKTDKLPTGQGFNYIKTNFDNNYNYVMNNSKIYGEIYNKNLKKRFKGGNNMEFIEEQEKSNFDNLLVFQESKDEIEEQIYNFTSKGVKTAISNQKLIEFFDKKIDSFLKDRIILEKTKKIWNGKYWETETSEVLKRKIHSAFKQKDIILNSKFVDELSKQLILQQPQIKSLRKDYTTCFSIVFNNGTFYMYPEKKYEFKENYFNKEDYNIFYLTDNFDLSLIESDNWKDSFIGKWFNDFFIIRDINIIQKYLSAILIPELEVQKALIIMSDGRNGKGTLLETIKDLLNEGAFTTLKVSKWEEKHETVIFKNSVLNWSDEIPDRHINAENFKSIISNDLTTINPKFEQPETIKPSCKHIFTTNEIPKFNEMGKAIIDRILLVKMTKNVSPDDQSVMFKINFMKDKKNLLNFMMRGLLILIRDNYKINGQDPELVKELIENSDNLSVFIDDCLEYCEGEITTREQLEGTFKIWKEKNSVTLKTENFETIIKRILKLCKAFNWNVLSDRKNIDRNGKGKQRLYYNIKIKT